MGSSMASPPTGPLPGSNPSEFRGTLFQPPVPLPKPAVGPRVTHSASRDMPFRVALVARVLGVHGQREEPRRWGDRRQAAAAAVAGG